MRDRQTGSLWSQVSGICILGPMEGTVLVQYPAFQTTFKEYKKQYPSGLVLKKANKGKRGSNYDTYFADKTRLGIFGRIDNFSRLGAKEKIFGLRLETREVAVSKLYLFRNHYRIINIEMDRILINYNPDTETVTAYYLPQSRTEQNLEFQVTDSTISQVSSDLIWSLSKGQVIKGSGRALRPVPVITAFWFAWVSFFPQTELIN